MHRMRKIVSVCAVVLSVLAMCPPVTAAGSSGNTYFDVGVFAYEAGKYEEALGSFTRALATGADKEYVYHYLGKTYLAMEKYDEASYNLEEASKINPDLPGLAYDTAMLSYRLAHYDVAARLFTKVVQNEPANVLARYHAGICLLRQEKYDEALPHFIAAGEKSPTLKTNCAYYIGICYEKTGESLKAQEQFRYVVAAAEDDLLKKYAASWLKFYEVRGGAKEEKPYQLFGKLGAQYDSNVVLESLDEDIHARKSDWALEGSFSGTYDFLRTDAWKSGVGYTHYQTEYSSLRELDCIASIGQLYVNWRVRPVTLGLNYLPHYFWLDNESYLMRHQVRPEVLWNISDRIISRLTASYYRNNYFEDDGKDGKTFEGAFDAFWRVSEEGSYLVGGVGYEINNARAEDDDYGQLRVKLGITLVLSDSWQANGVGRYFRQVYENDDSLYGIARKDDKYQVSFSVEKKLCREWLSLAGDFTLTRNDSTIDDFAYRRNVTTLSLIARY